MSSVVRGNPSFDLTINGRTLWERELRHVTTFELTESMDQLDAFSVTIAVPSQRDAIVDLLRLGNKFSAGIGYGSGRQRQVEGILIEVTHNYSQRGHTITARGLDNLFKLKQKTRTKVWQVGLPGIAQQLASEHGLGCTAAVPVPTPSAEFQNNVSDAEFLNRLAKRYNCFVRVKGNTLILGRRSLGAGSVQAKWGENLISFQCQQTINGLVTEVEVRGWNHVMNQPVIGRSTTPGSLRRHSGGELGPEIYLRAVGQNKQEIDNAPYQTVSECQIHAEGVHQENAEKTVKATLTMEGNPRAISGAYVNVQGVGKQSGPYLVRESKHTLDANGGYQTKLTLISDSLTRGA